MANSDAKIGDEQHFLQLAQSLLRGDGFAWGPERPTSLRPPLYPAVVTSLWWLGGEGNLQVVRFVQIFLSLVTAGLVYELGRRAFDPAVAAVAAIVTWLYPSLVFFNFTILTETLFTLLLVAFVLFGVMLVERGRPVLALACGLALGLGALTRSVLWPVPLVVCPLVLLTLRGAWPRRVLLAALVFAGYGLVVIPWAVRNTRLQGVVTIVDTMGGMNLRMGNYEHTPEDRMWDAVSLTGEQNWVYAMTLEPPRPEPPTEGEKDKWAQQKAIAYMRAHPMTTARRALIKFADFWGLEREFVAGVQQGFYAPPQWFTILGTALILLSFAATAALGGAGLWLARPDWRAHLWLLVPVVVITGVHTIVFGHSRYHIPLIPLLALYAAALWRTRTPGVWRERRLAAAGAAATVGVLAVVWIRQVVVTDAARIRALVDRIS
jgi:4-amino-4-deoxy-L-arabinose transferase-like glycosyltransferase